MDYLKFNIDFFKYISTKCLILLSTTSLLKPTQTLASNKS